MDKAAPARTRAALTVSVTLLIVLAEFVFLTAVYHLDDGADEQRVAQTRFSTAFATWRTGDDPGPVLSAAQALAGSDAPGSTDVLDRARAWAADPTSGNRAALAEADDAAFDAVVAAQRTDDLLASLIHGLLLVGVSIGWFLWFRTLVRRHRELQRRLTEREVVDAGERRLMALVHNSTDLVAVLEPDSTASFVSPSAAAVLGMEPAGLTGRRFTDLLDAADVPRFVRVLAAGEGEHPVLVRLRHSDGRDLTLEGTLNNLLADAAVGGVVLTLRDVTDRQRLQEQLTHQAFHDALTGLANRQLFRDRLMHALRKRAVSTPEPVVVLYLDLDDFKNVNDSLGHQVGDELLVVAGERLRHAVRQGDTAARLGGDEFAVLMEAADVESAQEVAERLIAALAEPVEIDGHRHVVRASVGIAEAFPGRTTSEDVLRNADVAMYWAKERGKGTIAVYDASLHSVDLERLALRSELQHAINAGQLVLHFQPVVDLDTAQVRGFEALVRWQHPERGLLPPAEFIGVAEQSGLIVPLGSWVLVEACRAGASLQTDGRAPTMSINVAAQQLARPEFVTEVVDALGATGMRADLLVLEITESVLLDDLDAAVTALSRLRTLGVRIAIDDFGTGYSSLAYLSRLPVDVLKVDKSFVDQVGGSSDETSVVEAIVAMSRTMSLVTVAEGVERHEQADWLRGARCSLGQGYLWSRPVELAVARGLLGGASISPAAPGAVTDLDEGDPVMLAG